MASIPEDAMNDYEKYDSREYKKDFRWCIQAMVEACQPSNSFKFPNHPFRMIDTVLLEDRKAQAWLRTTSTGQLEAIVDSDREPIMTKDVLEMLDGYLVQFIDQNANEWYAQIVSETERMKVR